MKKQTYTSSLLVLFLLFAQPVYAGFPSSTQTLSAIQQIDCDGLMLSYASRENVLYLRGEIASFFCTPLVVELWPDSYFIDIIEQGKANDLIATLRYVEHSLPYIKTFLMPDEQVTLYRKIVGIILGGNNEIASDDLIRAMKKSSEVNAKSIIQKINTIETSKNRAREKRNTSPDEYRRVIDNLYDAEDELRKFIFATLKKHFSEIEMNIIEKNDAKHINKQPVSQEVINDDISKIRKKFTSISGINQHILDMIQNQEIWNPIIKNRREDAAYTLVTAIMEFFPNLASINDTYKRDILRYILQLCVPRKDIAKPPINVTTYVDILHTYDTETKDFNQYELKEYILETLGETYEEYRSTYTQKKTTETRSIYKKENTSKNESEVEKSSGDMPIIAEALASQQKTLVRNESNEKRSDFSRENVSSDMLSSGITHKSKKTPEKKNASIAWNDFLQHTLNISRMEFTTGTYDLTIYKDKAPEIIATMQLLEKKYPHIQTKLSTNDKANVIKRICNVFQFFHLTSEELNALIDNYPLASNDTSTGLANKLVNQLMEFVRSKVLPENPLVFLMSA